MEFILDTNAYRNLARGLTLANVPAYAEKLKQAEDNTKSSSALSIVVAMELIQHLQKDNPFRDECYKALCLQTLHTRRYDFSKRSITGSFYPPMNVILAQYFFKDNSKYFPLYMKVLELVLELTKNQDITNCDTNATYVDTVKNQILFEKNEFKDNVENFLSSLNSGTLDWKYIRNNNEGRKKFFDKIQSGHIANLLGVALMIRAHQVMEIEELAPDAEAKIEQFINDFKAVLIMNVTLVEQIGHGTEKLKDVTDARWNTLNDVQILFGLLYYRNGDDKKVLVTEEKKIKEACDVAGIGDRVLTIAEYLTVLGL